MPSGIGIIFSGALIMTNTVMHMRYGTRRRLNVHDIAKEVLQCVNQHGVSKYVREQRLQHGRERERARPAAETAVEKEERL